MVDSKGKINELGGEVENETGEGITAAAREIRS